MASTIDHEVTAVKEDNFTHSSQETGGTTCHLGPCGEAPGVFQKVEKGEEKHGGKVYVTRQAGRLSSCVYVHVTLGAEAASGCLVSGSKEII